MLLSLSCMLPSMLVTSKQRSWAVSSPCPSVTPDTFRKAGCNKPKPAPRTLMNSVPGFNSFSSFSYLEYTTGLLSSPLIREFVKQTCKPFWGHSQRTRSHEEQRLGPCLYLAIPLGLFALPALHCSSIHFLAWLQMLKHSSKVYIGILDPYSEKLLLKYKWLTWDFQI